MIFILVELMRKRNQRRILILVLKNISITNDTNKDPNPSNGLIKLAGQELDLTFVDSANLSFPEKTKIDLIYYFNMFNQLQIPDIFK